MFHFKKNVEWKLWGDTLRLCKVRFPSCICRLVQRPWIMLRHRYPGGKQTGGFSSSDIPSTFVIWNSSEKLNVLLFVRLFISIWAHKFFLYSMDYSSLLSLFILLLKLSLMWPVGTPSGWLLCPSDVSPGSWALLCSFPVTRYRLH